MDSTFPATTPTSTSTAPPANTQPFGKSTANDMIAAAMIRMITAVQAATLCPWSSSCSLMASTFVQGSMTRWFTTILSGRGVWTHIGGVTSGAALVPLARDPLPARSGRLGRGPVGHLVALRRAAPAAHPDDRADQTEQGHRAGQQGDPGPDRGFGHRLDRAGAAHARGGDWSEHCLGVEQDAYGEGDTDREDRDGGGGDGEGDGAQPRGDLGAGGADPRRAEHGVVDGAGHPRPKGTDQEQPGADECQEDDDALGRQPRHVT